MTVDGRMPMATRYLKAIGFAALACELGTVHEPLLVNDIDDGAVPAIGDTDPRAFHKNATFGVLLDLLAVPALFIFQDSGSGYSQHKLCMQAFRFVRYRRPIMVWLVLGREPGVVGCAVVGVVALNDSTEGVRLGLIDSLGGRQDNMGGVDTVDEEKEGLQSLVEGRCWSRGMGSFWKGHVAVRK